MYVIGGSTHRFHYHFHFAAGLKHPTTSSKHKPNDLEARRKPQAASRKQQSPTLLPSHTPVKMATEGVTVTAPPATYRRREHPNPELEAGVELKLGAFQHVPSLSVPEARLVISKIFDMRKQTGGGDASGAGGGGYAHAIMENEFVASFSFSLYLTSHTVDGWINDMCLTIGHCNHPRILLRTQDYLEAFSRFEDKDSLEVVEQRLNQRAQLESFERSQLGAGFFFFFLFPIHSIPPWYFPSRGAVTIDSVCSFH